MPKVTINGVKFEADTQAELDAAVKSFGSSSKPEPKAKPAKPAKAAPTASKTEPKKYEKIPPEDLKKRLNADFGATILDVINAEMGFDLLGGVRQMAQMVNGIQRDSVKTFATLALERANVEPTDKNITELTELVASTKGSDADLSLATLSSVASEAVKNDWLTAKTEDSSKKSSSDPSEGEPAEKPLPARRTAKAVQFGDEPDADSPSEEELEKVIAEMDESELFSYLSEA